MLHVMPDDSAAPCRDAFRRTFGHAADVVARAPGRVNLIGDHTDYADGFALPLAINRWTDVALGVRAAPGVDLHALDLDERLQLGAAPREPLDHHHWANYPLGVLECFRRQGVAPAGLDLVVTSTIPPGMGLSSSAALTVATCMAMETVTGQRLQPWERVAVAQGAEHHFAGTPCGILDPFTIVHAHAGAALLLDCRSNRAEPVALPAPAAARLLVFESGVRHSLAESEYAERRAACARAARQLGVSALRDATPAQIAAAGLDEIDARRATHVVFENTRVLLTARALLAGDLAAVGEQMFASHASLRDLYAVSTPELDHLVESAHALRGSGVFGARLTGGGFGGSVIMMVQTEAAAEIAAVIRDRFAATFGPRPGVFEVTAVGSAAVLSPSPAGDESAD